MSTDRNPRLVRWQGHSVAQLGFVDNTLLALTTASLSFAVSRESSGSVQWILWMGIVFPPRVDGACSVLRTESATRFSRIGPTGAGQDGPRGTTRATAQEPEAWRVHLGIAQLPAGHFRTWGGVGRSRRRTVVQTDRRRVTEYWVSTGAETTDGLPDWGAGAGAHTKKCPPHRFCGESSRRVAA